MTDPALLELRRLAAEVAELRETQEHLMRALLSRQDRRVGSAVVPLLAEVFEGQTFCAADLAAASLNRRDSVGEALRELVAEYCTAEGGLRALGRLLMRLEGCSFGGCRLQAAGALRGALRWRVRVF